MANTKNWDSIKGELDKVGQDLKKVGETYSPQLQKLTRFEAQENGIVLSKINPGLGNLGGVTKFPFDLEPEKTMAIHVYDTSVNDKIYQGTLDTTQNVMAIGSSMFGNLVNKTASWITGSEQHLVGQVVPRADGGLWGNNTQGFLNDVDSGLKNFVNQLPSTAFTPANGKLAKTYHETFYLPIPNGLQEAVSNTYEDQPGWINDMPFMGEGGIVQSTIGSIAEKSATYAKNTGARHIQYYENQIQMYTSTDFREITLQWDLVPNNAQESKALHELARKIKMYGSPESAAGKILVKSPCFFGIEFNNEVLDNALQFCEVVLVSLNVDYVPGGNMEMNEDQTPKMISLSMSFRDREPKLRENWEQSRGCKGNSSNDNDLSCPV